jgi:MFS family permease
MEKDLSSLPPVRRGIASPKLKSAVFVLEGINSLATTYYYYYIYFYTKERYHFGATENLLLAALLGFVYALASFYGGRFAQRFGYFTSIRLGIAGMIGAFLAASQAGTVELTIALTVVASVAMCLTWPALEGLLSEGEPPARLPGLMGVYNCVWAATAGLAYFTGGAVVQKWGWQCMFYVPAALLVLGLSLAGWLHGKARQDTAMPKPVVLPLLHPMAESYRSPIAPATFLKLGWVANPMAYLAVNTVISSVPTLAGRLGFTPMLAGFVCSIWLLARAAAFVALWLWPGWHYRFRFLASAYVVVMVSFAAMLLVPNRPVLVFSQLLLGPALGLIYYSSLFYSMDVGATKGEHGGIHEAVIGVGNTIGPASAAAALRFFPGHPGSGVWAVCVLLTGGLVVLYWLRYREPKAPG